MADEILRSKHAFGNLEDLPDAINENKVDKYDILFVKDAEGKARIGWIDRNGEVVMVTDEKADLSQIEADVDVLENEIAKKADAETVNSEIEDLNKDVSELVSNIATCENSHEKIKYEISDVPVGTLVKMTDHEIRIMCPKNSVFTKQSVGTGGDGNCYYMTFKTYAPNDDVVGYIEHLGNQVDEEILTTFSIDEYGRKYQQTWLAIAKYDESTDTWTYYGANSSVEKYIGWDYQIDWYDSNGVIIASDKIRINLSNEECHYEIKPYYLADISKEIDTKIETKIAEVEAAYEVVEF